MAALKVFNNQASEFIPVKTIFNLIEDIAEKKLDEIIIPVENSIAGSVTDTIDALSQASGISISQEYIMPIKHCLLASQENLVPGTLTDIYAHMMTFKQCRQYLRKHYPNATQHLSSSNSEAAKYVSSLGAFSSAAIASDLCAEIYKLKILAEGINDEINNQTRFWLISGKQSSPSGRDKTSIVFETKSEPGSLVRILSCFAEAGINLSRVESRPSRRNLGEYIFYLDLDAHQEDESFIKSISQAKKFFSFYKCLGSYNSIIGT